MGKLYRLCREVTAGPWLGIDVWSWIPHRLPMLIFGTEYAVNFISLTSSSTWA